eukprot:COSAG01_NODE_811_length_13417_cov_6.641012_1_plen_611_part_00
MVMFTHAPRMHAGRWLESRAAVFACCLLPAEMTEWGTFTSSRPHIMADEATAAAALKQRGSSLFQAADFAGAAAAFGSAAELEPGVAAHHSNCSLAWLKLAGNPAHDGSPPQPPPPPPPPQQQQHAVAALASAERCVALEPRWSKAHYRRGAALLRLGRGAEALAAFERAEQLLRLEEDEAVAAAVPEGGGGAGERGGLPSPGGKGGGKQQRQRQELEGAMAAARAAVLSSSPPPPPPQPSSTTTTTGRRDGDEDAEAAARDATAAAMARRRKQKDKKKRQRQRKQQQQQQQQQQQPLAGELGGAEGQPYVGFPVGVVQDPGSRRRCVVARRDLRVGEVVWQAQAWASAVSDPFLRTTCAFCFGSLPAAAAAASQAPATPPPEVVSCPRCEVPSYCDAECRAAVRQAFPSMLQSILTEIYRCHTCSCHEILRVETPGQAAPIHELECAALRQAVRMTAAAKQESTGVRLLVRMLAQRRLEQQQPPPPQHGQIRRRRRRRRRRQLPEADQAGAEGAPPPAALVPGQLRGLRPRPTGPPAGLPRRARGVDAADRRRPEQALDGHDGGGGGAAPQPGGAAGAAGGAAAHDRRGAMQLRGDRGSGAPLPRRPPR